MKDYLNRCFSAICEMLDDLPLSDESRDQNKEAVHTILEQVLEYSEKGNPEMAKKAFHHLSMEITRIIAQINSEYCKIAPGEGRFMVANTLKYLEERQVKAKYGDAILGDFSEMEQMLQDRTKVLDPCTK